MKNRLPLILFVFSLAFFAFGYGFIAALGKHFPYPQIVEVLTTLKDQLDPWIYIESESPQVQTVYDKKRAYPGLNLVTCMGADQKLVAKVVDMDGLELHRWNIDWFEIWPDAEHISPSRRPKSRPGTSIHGAVLTAEGDLIFNFEGLGLVRLDKGGKVVWKLPYQTHHAIYEDDAGALWVLGLIDHTEHKPDFPNFEPEFADYTVLKVSKDGQLLDEFSVLDVLKDNGLYGLLTMSAVAQRDTTVTDDTVHLNDVDIFPRTMKEGFFKHGDIMISLRNINAVLILTPEGRVKYTSIGKYVRQHDPDFIDGNTFSVFDNNNVTGAPKPSSRIVLEHVPSGETEVFFEGTDSMPFFTDIMGKHQWLPNGNALITESGSGCAFEITSEGGKVWDYYNVIGENTLGVISEVSRLPASFDAVFR